MKQRGAWFSVKRAMDLAVALPALAIAAPLIGATAVALRVSVGPGVLFRQLRPGRNAQPFVIYKFRTMTNERDADGKLLPDEVRLTRVGKIVRSLSLDELPQLLNVARGEMSMVGPRPLMMQYVERYSPEQMRRHDVLPGITGWAQINGRNALSWEEKFRHDVWYVEHWNPALDLAIVAKTVARVLQRDGIANQDSATMPEFMGSPEEPKRHE